MSEERVLFLRGDGSTRGRMGGRETEHWRVFQWRDAIRRQVPAYLEQEAGDAETNF